LPSPEYSARKQYVPAAEVVKTDEVAVAVFPGPGASVTAPPTAEPPLAQLGGGVVARGPQTKKVTVPVGLPPAGLPVTVAWSVSPAAKLVVRFVGVDLVLAVALPTVKHSPLEPPLEPP
jgi:hypothetical protein